MMGKDNRHIMISGAIDEDMVSMAIQQIHKYNMEDMELESTLLNYEREPIVMTMNSVGGSVYDGFALISAIELSITPIVTQVLGSAMSMGLAIALSGHYRYAHRLSTFMYHEISNGYFGKLTDHQDNVYELKRLQKLYDNYIIERSEISRNKLAKIKKHKRDYFFSAEEALELGFIDGLLEVETVEEETEEENQAE